MKKEILDVYERPEVEEVKLAFASNILSGNMENPGGCTCDMVCFGDTQ